MDSHPISARKTLRKGIPVYNYNLINNPIQGHAIFPEVSGRQPVCFIDHALVNKKSVTNIRHQNRQISSVSLTDVMRVGCRKLNGSLETFFERDLHNF